MFNQKHIKVGIAPINWSNDDLPELGGDISFETCIKEMAQAGYEGCEVGHKFSKEPAKLKAQLAPLNLHIASAWFSCKFAERDKFDSSIQDFAKHIDFLSSMGSKTVVIAECGFCLQHEDIPFYERPSFTDKQWMQVFQGIEALGEIADSYNMNIAIHPHVGTGIFTIQDIDKVFDNVNSQRVNLLLDTGHLFLAAEDPIKVIDKYGCKIKHVHLKDIRKEVYLKVLENKSSFLESVKAGIFTVPGDGYIDFEKVLKKLDSADYSGWLIVEAEQDPKLASPLEYAVKGRRYLHDLAGV